MHHLIACIFCGGVDPANDSMLLQMAIAGAVTTPWVLRARLRTAIDRLRGVPRGDDPTVDACTIPYGQDGDPPNKDA